MSRLWMSKWAVLKVFLATSISLYLSGKGLWLFHPSPLPSGPPLSCGIVLEKGRRLQMEDFAICIPVLADFGSHAISYTGVFDGHEGLGAAKFARSKLHVYLKAELALARQRQGIHAAIEMAFIKAFKRLNKEFLAIAQAQNWTDGATAVIAIKAGPTFMIAHAGDSRALLCGVEARNKQEVQASLLTEDHTPGVEKEKERIIREGGFVAPDSAGRLRLQGELSVSRSIGDLPYTEFGLIATPTLSKWVEINSLQDGTWLHFSLILATDGLFESLTSQEICQAAWSVAKGNEPPNSAQPMEAIALPFAPSTTDFGGKPDVMGLPTSNGSRVETLQGGQEEKLGLQDEESYARDCAWSPDDFSYDTLLQDQPGLTARRTARWLATEAYNRMSMDNIAVAVMPLNSLDVEPDDSAERRQRASSLSIDGMMNGKSISSAGNLACYQLLDRLASLPQAQHWHSGHQSQIVLRQSDELQQRWGTEMWGQARLWAETHQPAILAEVSALDHEKSGLVSRLATLPLAIAGSEQDPMSLRPVETDPVSSLADYRLSSHWQLDSQLGQGSFGEVWRALRTTGRGAGVQGESGYVLKQLRASKDTPEQLRLSFSREAYFGQLINRLTSSLGACNLQDSLSCLDGKQHLVRYIESFEAEQKFWLVFKDEGVSLHSLMYSAMPGCRSPECPSEQVQMLQISPWWIELRNSSQGEEVIRDILRQTLSALQVLHHANITHRDVKPENMLIQLNSTEVADNTMLKVHLRLIDMGSAVDPESFDRLYGSKGPTDREQTHEYAPPEALLARYWSVGGGFRESRAYDLWSVGISWLEMILGTPHVFSITDRMKVILHQALHLDQKPQEERELAYWLRGVMQLCIYPPRPDRGIFRSQGTKGGGQPSHRNAQPVAWSCSESSIMQAIREKDPLRSGLPSIIALRLMQALLHWNPAARPAPQQALRHMYFSERQQEADCHSNWDEAGWC